jgi:hypothetical protein
VATFDDVVAGRARGAAPAATAPTVTTGPDRTLAMSPETAAGLVAAIPAQTVNGGSTASALEVRVAPPRRNVLPVVLGGLLLLAVALLVWLKFGGKPSSAEADRPLAANSAAPSALPSAPPVTVLGPALTDTSAADTTAKPGSKPAAHAAPADKVAPEPVEPKPLPAITLPNATPPATAHPAPRVERCFADPFTGQVRVAGAGRADSFACHQNPFTGAYQRQ